MSAESLLSQRPRISIVEALNVPRFAPVRSAALFCADWRGCFVALPSFASGYAMTLAVEVMIAGVFGVGHQPSDRIHRPSVVGAGYVFSALGGYGIAVGTALLGWPLWVSAPITLVCRRDDRGGYRCNLHSNSWRRVSADYACRFRRCSMARRLNSAGTNGVRRHMSGIPRPDLSQLGLSAHSPVVFLLLYPQRYRRLALLPVVAHREFSLWECTDRHSRERTARHVDGLCRGQLQDWSIRAFRGDLRGSQASCRRNTLTSSTRNSMSWQVSGEGVFDGDHRRDQCDPGAIRRSRGLRRGKGRH